MAEAEKVSKTQVLHQLQDEVGELEREMHSDVASLRKELQAEREERENLMDWIRDVLKPSLSQMKDDTEGEVASLRKSVKHERETRSDLISRIKDLSRKLNDEGERSAQTNRWIRDNIGTDLEVVMDRVDSRLKNSKIEMERIESVAEDAFRKAKRLESDPGLSSSDCSKIIDKKLATLDAGISMEAAKRVIDEKIDFFRGSIPTFDQVSRTAEDKARAIVSSIPPPDIPRPEVGKADLEVLSRDLDSLRREFLKLRTESSSLSAEDVRQLAADRVQAVVESTKSDMDMMKRSIEKQLDILSNDFSNNFVTLDGTKRLCREQIESFEETLRQDISGLHRTVEERLKSSQRLQESILSPDIVRAMIKERVDALSSMIQLDIDSTKRRYADDLAAAQAENEKFAISKISDTNIVAREAMRLASLSLPMDESEAMIARVIGKHTAKLEKRLSALEAAAQVTPAPEAVSPVVQEPVKPRVRPTKPPPVRVVESRDDNLERERRERERREQVEEEERKVEEQKRLLQQQLEERERLEKEREQANAEKIRSEIEEATEQKDVDFEHDKEERARLAVEAEEAERKVRREKVERELRLERERVEKEAADRLRAEEEALKEEAVRAEKEKAERQVEEEARVRREQEDAAELERLREDRDRERQREEEDRRQKELERERELEREQDRERQREKEAEARHKKELELEKKRELEREAERVREEEERRQKELELEKEREREMAREKEHERERKEEERRQKERERQKEIERQRQEEEERRRKERELERELQRQKDDEERRQRELERESELERERELERQREKDEEEEERRQRERDLQQEREMTGKGGLFGVEDEPSWLDKAVSKKDDAKEDIFSDLRASKKTEPKKEVIEADDDLFSFDDFVKKPSQEKKEEKIEPKKSVKPEVPHAEKVVPAPVDVQNSPEKADHATVSPAGTGRGRGGTRGRPVKRGAGGAPGAVRGEGSPRSPGGEKRARSSSVSGSGSPRGGSPRPRSGSMSVGKPANLEYTDGLHSPLENEIEDIFKESKDISWVLVGPLGTNSLEVRARGNSHNVACVRDALRKSPTAPTEVLYAYMREGIGVEKRPKFVLMTWLGPKLSPVKKAKSMNHRNAVRGLFRHAHVEMTVSHPNEIQEADIKGKLAVAGGANYDGSQNLSVEGAVVGKFGSIKQQALDSYRKRNAQIEQEITERG